MKPLVIGIIGIDADSFQLCFQALLQRPCVERRIKVEMPVHGRHSGFHDFGMTAFEAVQGTDVILVNKRIWPH